MSGSTRNGGGSPGISVTFISVSFIKGAAKAVACGAGRETELEAKAAERWSWV
jgi:hypothetical protein